jgi:hypothetical protein
MIEGHLLQLGHRVPREHLRASYNRVHSAPSSFSNRPIQRRVYRVAGPNSLSYHDGQHGVLPFSNHSLTGRLQFEYFPRSQTMENHHPWLHRWIFLICLWDTGCEQQLFRHCFGPLPEPCYSFAWCS